MHMDILKIGQTGTLQNELQDWPVSRQSAPSRPTDEDHVKVDIGLPGTDHTVYDRNGKVSGSKESTDSSKTTESDDPELSDEEQQELQELKQTDSAVRAHEMAHVAAGGSLVRGGPSFEYRKGPDGNNYAVSGEVNIDSSKEKTPEQTLIKMQRVQAAALAPADPSGQDRAVASQAAQTAQQARVEIARKAMSGNEGSPSGPGTGTDKAAGSHPYKAAAGNAVSSGTRTSFHTIV